MFHVVWSYTCSVLPSLEHHVQSTSCRVLHVYTLQFVSMLSSLYTTGLFTLTLMLSKRCKRAGSDDSNATFNVYNVYAPVSSLSLTVMLVFDV